MSLTFDRYRSFAAGAFTSRLHDEGAQTARLTDGVPGLEGAFNTALVGVTGDTVPGDISSTVTLTVDAPSVVSTIDTIGDQDFYKVQLVAGKTYDFGMNAVFGGPGGAPLGDSFLEVYDAAGNLVTSGDGGGSTPLNEVNSGFDVLLTFTAQTTGTYFLNARGFDNVPEDGTTGDMIGDYEIFVDDVSDEPRYVPYYDPTSPLYAIDWGSQVDGTVRNPDGAERGHVTGNPAGTPTPTSGIGVTGKNVISIYFAKFGEPIVTENLGGLPPATVAVGAKDFERAAVWTALHEFEKVADIVYVEVFDRALANFTYATYTGTPGPGVSLLGSMSPPNESDEGLALFNSGDYRWNATNLAQGGFSFVTLIHEFGHGHGLAHPHDNGGKSGIMNGVTSDGPVADYTTGDFALNQAVFTMMSYEDGWQSSPYGNAPTDVGYGYLGGLMAFDIAAIQDKYGVNEDYAAGDNTYVLKDVNAAGTFFSSIWDGGGRDTIRYDGAKDAVIDLRAATLEYEVGGGGNVSYATGIFGGFTIANGAVIEVAKGGSGNDALIGNSGANTLFGYDGNDVLEGGGGRDFLLGGAGIDTASYQLAGAAVSVRLATAGYQDTGGAGVDKLETIENLAGSAYGDRLVGSNLANTVRGGAGNDTIFGLGGADILVGGTGADKLTGGSGADIFRFATGDIGGTSATADRILDFTREDTIDLSAVDANGVVDGDQAFAFIGTRTFTGTAGELRVVQIGNNWVVTGDTNGDKVTDLMIVVAGDQPLLADFMV